MAITLENKESIRYDVTVTLITLKCCTCGVPYAIPERLNNQLRETQDTFYCPNGHPQVYRKSTADILREKLEAAAAERIQSENQLKRQVELQKNNAEFWNLKWDKELQEKKKIDRKLKRTEKMIAHGVCPCCKRTFSDLAAHMKTKHPDFINDSK